VYARATAAAGQDVAAGAAALDQAIAAAAADPHGRLDKLEYERWRAENGGSGTK